MRWRSHCIIITALVIAFGIVGNLMRSGYTNISDTPEFLDDIQVAEVSASVAVKKCEALKDELDFVPLILKVVAVDTIEYFFCGARERVRVEQVFSGEGLEIGQEIYITSDGWKMYCYDKTVDANFVNFMKEDRSYLIFLSGSAGYTEDRTEVFQLYSKQLISPVFSYEDCENKIVATSEEYSYVPYYEVSENEFFAMDEEALNAFLSLKQEMLSKFN